MKIAIIGVGAMGGAITSGILESGFPPSDLILSNPTRSKIERFACRGATVAEDNVQAAAAADVVILAVKPWLLEKVTGEIVSGTSLTGKAVVSVAAGITGAELCVYLADKEGNIPDIAIAMPNTAATLGKSITFLVNVTCPDPRVRAIFERVGTVMTVDEEHLPAAMALASCGIAFAMRYMRAATEGGVELGIRAMEAQAIVARTVEGAAALLLQPGAHAEAEIDKVTTPGGLTIRGLNAMEAAGFTPAVIAGHRACLPPSD